MHRNSFCISHSSPQQRRKSLKSLHTPVSATRQPHSATRAGPAPALWSPGTRPLGCSRKNYRSPGTHEDCGKPQQTQMSCAMHPEHPQRSHSLLLPAVATRQGTTEPCCSKGRPQDPNLPARPYPGSSQTGWGHAKPTTPRRASTWHRHRPK